MKWNPVRWLWGLVPIAMLCWLAVLSERDRVETDLKARAQAALGAAGMSWAGSTFNGRDAVLTGQAADDAEPDQAYRKVLGTWGVRVVDNRAELLEKAEPYTWSAKEQGNRIRLAGHVPNESTRKALLASVKSSFAKHEVEDRMKLARGAPPRDTYIGAVGFALKQLAQLKDGTAELEGANLTMIGAADSTATFKSVKTALASNLPVGVKLKADRVTPPMVSPYLWTAKLDHNQLTLGGYVPSEQQRTALTNTAKAALPRSAIVDRMELAEGAPEGWAAAAQTAVRELGRLEDGSAELRAAQLTVAGTATNDVIADSVKKSLRERTPASIRMSEAIKFKGPVIPTINPYRTMVDAGPQAVVLTGHAPTEAALTAIGETAKARLPGRRIDNKLEIGNGAPNGWQACMQFGLAGLGRLGGGKASMNGNALQVAGETDDEALAKTLPGEIEMAAAQACDSDVKVSVRETPEPSLNWKASHQGAQVVLEGDVPDAGTKSDLAQAAARLFPGASIVDRMRVANVAPGRWKQAAELGLAQVARLRFGSVDIKGQVLTVSGEADDRGTVSAVHEQVTRRLGKGYTGQETVEVRSDADIASEEAKRRAEAENKRKVEDDARRRQELAALEDRKRAEEADARRKAEAADAKRRADQAAAEARQRAELARCQETLKQVASKGVIQFERASAEINARSNATLEELARSMKQCPLGLIEIEGHTDIEGAPDRNQRLSERRAASVMAYLTGAGVDPARLVSIGYGQDKPIATNDTPEGRAKNRRIEFTVKAAR